MRKWTKAQAVAWLKQQGFKHGDYDKMANYHSFRQEDPGQYRKFRVDKSPFNFGRDDGVIVIYGIREKEGKTVSEMQSIRFYHGETDEANRQNQGSNVAENVCGCRVECQADGFSFIAHRAETSLVRLGTLDERAHLVAPVVAIRAGVLNGELVPAEEIGRYVDAWNGIPLPIGHPRERGAYVSANRPDLLETQSVGRFFNARFEDGALQGEIWVDIEKARQLGPAGQVVLERLEHNEPLEVSTAYFRDIEERSGVWEGKHYSGIARNLRPDHLALLPYQIGACSWVDGCGAPRANEEEEKKGRGGGIVVDWFARQLTNVAKMLGLNTNRVGMSHRAIDDALEAAMVAATGDSMSFFIQEVYDDFFIYRARDGKHFKRTYAIDAQKNVTLGNPVQVEKVWRDVNQTAGNEGNGEQGETNDIEKGVENMNGNANTGKGWNRCQVIEQLIANGAFTGDDRSWLTQAPDEVLKKLVGLAVNQEQEGKEEGVGQPGGQQPQGGAGEGSGQTGQDAGQGGEPGGSAVGANAAKELLDLFDPDFKEFIINERKKHQEYRAQLIKDLTANAACQFAAEDLAQMKTACLEKLAASLMPADYSGRVVPRVPAANQNEDDAVPAPPSVLLRKDGEGEGQKA